MTSLKKNFTTLQNTTKALVAENSMKVGVSDSQVNADMDRI